MPPQPSTLFEIHTQQQPFALAFEHEVWHVTFPGHRCELDVHGTHIEAQAIARCYYSLFLMPGAPFAYAGLSECDRLDLAEREAAIEIEVQERRLGALLYVPSGDGALPSVGEPPVRYQAGDACPRRVRVVVEEDYPDGTYRVAFDSQEWSDRDRFQESVLGYVAYTLQHRTPATAFHQVCEASAKYGHDADRGDGRDARGRFVDGGQAARECGHLGFEAAIESIIARYPDATYTRNPGDEVHISRSFFYWLQQQGRA